MSAQEPTEEELRAAFEEQMRRIRVEDVIVQTAATLVTLAGRRLGLAPPGEQAEDKDLGQAKLAIEGVRALVPLLPEAGAPIREALAQLQMAFAREAQQPGEAAPGEPDADAPQPSEAPSADEAERAKARSKLWTPPGT